MLLQQVRVRYLLLLIATVAAGLVVHRAGGFMPPAVRDVVGDALWAMMIVWLIGAAAPALPRRTRALSAFAICVAVEISQLYHGPLIDAVRATLLGQLVLGTGYDPRDVLAYAAGIAVAGMLSRRL